VAAFRAVDAARQSLELAQKLVEDNRIRVEVGTLAPLDIVQAEAEAATRRQTLASAEATRRTAELVLKRLIVASTADALWDSVIEPSSVVRVEDQRVDLEGAVTRALKDRTDIVNARKQLDSNDVSIAYLKNQMNPALDATFNVGTRGLGGNQFVRVGGVVVDTIPGGWTDAMQMLPKFEYPIWTAQVNFSYPLGKSTQEAQYARARVQYQQAEAQLRALELQVATEVTNAALNIESTQRRVEAARAARVLAERRLEAEQTKFEVGMQTNFFVVQAQRDLLDSQITELRATLDYQRALIEFERLQLTSSSGGSVTTVSTAGGTAAR
jgi:outer membrane protein TolC